MLEKHNLREENGWGGQDLSLYYYFTGRQYSIGYCNVSRDKIVGVCKLFVYKLLCIVQFNKLRQVF